MIIVVIGITLTALLYNLKYRLYQARIANFILRTRCFKNTLKEVEEAIRDTECEIIEVNSHFYKFIVDKSNLKEYYPILIREAETLSITYDKISRSVLFVMDDELELMLWQMSEDVTRLYTEIRVRKWRSGY